jgi:hypothetical protein
MSRTDAERVAPAGLLAGYRSLTREAYALDLRQFAVLAGLPHQRISAAVADVETEASVELEKSLVRNGSQGRSYLWVERWCGRAAGVPGQQSLTVAVTAGCGGGQLMAVAGPACAEAAGLGALASAAAGGVPLTHLGSVHSMAAAAAGGTPLMQSGVVQVRDAVTGGGSPPHAAGPVQAPAAVTVRLSEPAARAAETTALAATRLTTVTVMVFLFLFGVMTTVTCAADASLKPG